MGYPRIPQRFTVEILSSIQYGPSHKIAGSVVTYRTFNNQLRWYADFRLNSYDAKKNKYYASFKGITLNEDIALKLYEELLKLPEEMPILNDGEVRNLGRFKKYANTSVNLSLVNYDNTTKIDIREWTDSEINGYKGPTKKGVRFEYSMREFLIGGLILMINRMKDIHIEYAAKPGLDKNKVI